MLKRSIALGIAAVVVSAQRILNADPFVVYVVPLTSTVRGFRSEITIDPDDYDGLGARYAAHCQHLRSVSTGRIVATRGDLDAATLAQIRKTIAIMLAIPT